MKPSQHPLETVGRYELLTRIATGGMAEIFLARERGLAGLERLVVIKRILPHLVHQQSFVDMFLREARIIARLAHPNIVQIYELAEDKGSYFLALEYIHGCTVRELQVLSARQHEPFPLAVALAIIGEACRGAHAAHELTDTEGKPQGLVHRDISPHNLMVTPRGHVKLLDFGIAKAAEGFESTASGNLKGKYAYMSPEQCLHLPLDRRSDVFALGISLWELCTGRRLFQRKTEIEMLQSIIHTDAPPVDTLNPGIPRSISDVIARALSNERETRTPSADAFRQEIHDAAKTEGLSLDSDRVGEFLRKVGGDRLTERDQVLDKAREHTLNSADGMRLTHVTSSLVSQEPDGPTVADRPSVSTLEKVRDLPSELLPTVFDEDDAPTGISADQEIVALDSEDEDVAEPPSDEPSATMDIQPDTGSGNHVLGMVLALVVLVGLAIAGVWIVASTDDAPTENPNVEEEKRTIYPGDPVIIGLAPTVDTDVLLDELRPLGFYLEDALEQPVEFRVTESYQDLADKVLNGDLAFGVFPPLLYIRTSNAGNLTPVAIKEFDGAHNSDGYLLVRHSDRIDTIEDLQGKTFCFTDPDSTTGYFLPRAFIRKKGFDVNTFVGDINWSGDHLQVIRDLIAGKCSAASTYNGAFLTANTYGIPTGQLRVLEITGHVPQDVVAAGPASTDAQREIVGSALVAFDPVVVLGEPRMGDNQRITGFAPPDESAFDHLRGVVASESDSTIAPEPPGVEAPE